MTIDQPYREWWKAKGKGDLPKDYVLPVNGALQGHPESARLWAILINDILVNDLKFKPTTHEQCLYSGTFKDQEILFLRQVDDFAIACQDEGTAKEIIESINNKMSVDIHYLGLIDRFNGVDVTQTKNYIKIHNRTYIKKIIEGHKWLPQTVTPLKPIPMHADTNMLESLRMPVHQQRRTR